MYPSDEGSELVAGTIAPAGCYVRVDVRDSRRVILEHAGPLPASLDGAVAVYEPIAALTPALVGTTPRRAVVAID